MDILLLCDFPSPLGLGCVCVVGGGSYPQTERKWSPAFHRMSYSLPDHLSSFPERYDVNSRDPVLFPAFPKSLNNSTIPPEIFIFQGTQSAQQA